MPLAADKPRDPLASLRIQRDEPMRPRKRRRRWLRRLIFLLVFCGIVGGGAYAAHRAGVLNLNEKLKEVTEAVQTKVEARVATVTVSTGRSGDAVVVATGYLESRQQAKIGARGAGRIEVLNVDEGTPVKKGEILAILEHDDLKAALAAAKAAVEHSRAELAEQQIEIERSKRDFDRMDKLKARGSATEAEHDEARFKHEAAVAKLASMKAAIVQAEARVKEAEQITENMYVRAPFDGTVISKDAELGESILPGGLGEGSGRGSVVTIADLKHLEVDCDVKEDYISRITPGHPAEVAVDAVPDRRYKGLVRKIIPMGDRARATIKVKVEITDADERLFPEMSATVYFLPDKSEEEEAAAVPQKRIFCPSDAIVEEGDEHFVWLANEEGRINRVEVTPAAGKDGKTETLEGLEGGERVVLKPQATFYEGQLLKLVD